MSIFTLQMDEIIVQEVEKNTINLCYAFLQAKKRILKEARKRRTETQISGRWYRKLRFEYDVYSFDNRTNTKINVKNKVG